MSDDVESATARWGGPALLLHPLAGALTALASFVAASSARIFGDAPPAAAAFLAAFPFALSAAFIPRLLPRHAFLILVPSIALQALAVLIQTAAGWNNASNGWFDWAAFAVVQSMLWLLAAAGLWMRARRMPFEVRRCEETRSELESLFYMAQEQLPLEGMTYLGYLALLKQGAALVGGAGSENLFTVHLLIQPERIYLHSILTGEERRADFSLARFLLLCLRRPEFRYGPPEVVLALSPRERDRYASELHRAGFVAVAGGELGAGGVYREQLRNLPAQRFGQWRPFQKEIVFFQFRPETALQAMN